MRGTIMFYYDLVRSTTSTGSEATHLWGKTVANQQTVGIAALSVAARGSASGGGQCRLKTNTGTIASGGTGQTPAPANLRQPAADSVWANDGTTITPGTTLTQRMSVGFAQVGGPGTFVWPEKPARPQMMANGANPVDVEVTSVANASTPI